MADADPGRLAHLDQLQAASRDAVADVKRHFAAEQRTLNDRINSGLMTRADAIEYLCARYEMTEVGAADILDGPDRWSR